MTTLQFSEQQQAALQRREHTIVQAGAGSGKTRVIVEWFCKAFLDYFPTAKYDEIAAITFTEKAAGELRRRIRERLRQLQEEYKDPQRHSRVKMLNSFLILARIETIHAFCARILRESWREAGVDPEFEILDEVRQYQFLDEAIEETLAAWAVENSEKQANLILLLTAYGSHESLKRELRAALRQRSRFLKAMTHFKERAVEEILTELSKHIENIRKNNQSDEQVEDSQVDLLRDIQAFVSGLCTSRGARGKKSRRCEPEDADLRATIEFNKIFAQLFEDALKRYRTRCNGRENPERRDLFDFEELEIRTRDLLENNREVRTRIRGLKALIVDEFQDTSSIQWEIFKLILEPVDHPDSAAEHNGPVFFAVGDPAQSIYAWRQADPEIFHKSREWVEKHGGQVLTLSTNYRTQAPVLRVINDLSRSIFAVNTGSDSLTANAGACESSYMELTAHRGDDGGQVVWLVTDFTGTKDEEGADSGDVNGAEEPNGGLGNDMLAQAANIVEYIDQKILSSSPATQLRWGDVAFLCRKRRFFPAIEAVLRAKNISYITHGGEGFYDQPEVMAIINGLRVLDDHDDDFSLLGFLRGAFVHCPDTLLFKLAKLNRSSLWSKAQAAAYEQEESDSKFCEVEKSVIRRALEAIEKTGERVGAVTVDRLIEDLAEQLGAWGALELTENPRQAALNLQKLVAIAREFHTTSIGSFLTYVEGHEEAEEAEGLAPLPELSAEAAKIMTIHAAKGLEFPVVVIPFLESRLNLRVSFPATDGGQWFTCGKNLDIGSSGGDKNSLRLYLERWTKLRQRAEEKRIFYVAMTRAKDYLLLSSSKTKKEESKSVTPANSPDHKPSGLEIIRLPAQKRENIEILPNDKEGDEGDPGPIDQRYESLRAEALDECRQKLPEGEYTHETFRDRPLLAPPPLAVDAPLTVGVSEFISFLMCPTNYFYEYVLELPDRSPLSAGDGETAQPTDDQGSLSASEEGVLLHMIFENLLNSSGLPTEADVRQVVVEVLKTHLGTNDQTVYSALADKLVLHVKSAFKKFTRIQEATERRFEVGLVTRVDVGFAIRGTIDCIFRPDGRLFEIADFKTGGKATEDVAMHKYYELQMKVYLWMLSHQIPEQQTYRATLLYTHEDVNSKEVTLSARELQEFANYLREKAKEFRHFHRELVDGEIVVCPSLYEKLVSWCRRGERACPHTLVGRA